MVNRKSVAHAVFSVCKRMLARQYYAKGAEPTWHQRNFCSCRDVGDDGSFCS